MGELIYMRKQDEGIARYINSGINASELKNGKDFHVASIVVLDTTMGSHSLGGFLGTKSNVLFRDKEEGFKSIAIELMNDKNAEFVFETEIPKSDLAFYRLAEEIDIDLATEIGFGVVRYNGEYLIYSPFYKSPIDAVSEMLMLKIYFQLIHPDEVDPKLKNAFVTFEDVIQSKMIVNSAKHMNRLKEILGVE
ncbi:hypothetical protein BSK59_15720 [Paenibacillus odorifer]|uniref:hypothetical protein n=1 Tax=Paenibacillus odorifer TaxID=189426 RepID=UPI00096DC0CC|nr:hypothetical protein [Paenibacillus odorifer]OME54028.1 hypothetical protein BSK59_15720 [Paenibacillus odorifer]